MKSKITLYLLFFIVSLSLSAQDWKTYPHTPSGGSLISFPTDEGRHAAEPVEWWYTSGHFTGNTSGKEYSYMLTYFYYPVTVSIFNFEGFRILNITDETTGAFYQDTQPIFSYSSMSETELDIATTFTTGAEFWRNKLDGSSNAVPFQYELSASSSVASINFDLDTTKRPLILDGDGYFNQGLANYTYYYSQTANTLTGSFTLNGTTENVSGTAWIDRQYGDFNPFTGEKYEWFSLQLDNGTDLNLWNVFTADRTIPNDPKYKILAAYVDESTQYTISDFEIERMEYFFTADNQKSYSKKWRLTSVSKNIDLIITANHTTSEVDITQLSFRFFEGSITISGTIDGNVVNGVGFAELLHDYEKPDVSITNPLAGTYDTSLPITWDLNNPDDGRPVYYDLEYSIDNKVSFNTIVTGLTNNSYLWDGSGMSNGDLVWFKIKSYSIDNTLESEIISAAASTVTLALNRFELEEIKIYPNPVIDELYIDLPNVFNAGSIKIFDIDGRLLGQESINKTGAHNLNTAYLSKGMYILKFESNNFKEFIKFIKK